jgi:hypothetical protein
MSYERLFQSSIQTPCLVTNMWPTNKQTPWPVSASKLYRLSDCRLLAKLVLTFVVWVCHVVNALHPYGRIFGFLDRNRYFFFQVAPHLYSQGWVDPIPDQLLLKKSGSAGNRTRTSGSVARNWPLDHRGGQHVTILRLITWDHWNWIL